MADVILTRAKSITFASTALDGAVDFQVTKNMETVQNVGDGAQFEKKPASVVASERFIGNFNNGSTLLGLEVGATGTLVAVSEDGLGGSNVTVTIANAYIESIDFSVKGPGGSITWIIHNTDGTTNPIVIS